jgi:hypothetical protein
MAFAIFWMVIGELITLHQERIFGAYFYNHNNPFTKPKSKDDGHTYSFKLYKGYDKGYDTSNSFLYAVLGNTTNLILQSSKISHTFPAKQAHSFSRIVKRPLRAPPLS